MRVTAAQSCEPLRSLARNQCLKPQADELGLFMHAGQLAGPFDQLVVDVKRGSHMHQYA